MGGIDLCAIYNRDGVQEDNCTTLATCQVYKPCAFCYSIYVTYRGEDLPKRSGCAGSGHECHKNNTGRCVLENRLPATPRLPAIHYCCCYGDFCNKNVIIPHNLLPRTTPPQLKPTASLHHREMNTPNIFFYVLPPIFGVIILLAVLKRLYCRKENQPARNAALLLNSPPQSPLLQHDVIELSDIISRGQFRYVRKAMYNDKPVAVKIIPLHERSSWETERDIFTRYNLQHDNILLFLSAEKRSEDGIVQYWIITEYHQFGSLADYLGSRVLSFEELMRLAITMVEGLMYLHCEDENVSPPKPMIAHMDFKSRNVLVKSDFSCCISDFGSSSAFPKDNKLIEARPQAGTKRYMAPEMLQGAVAFQAESFLRIDIYALGLVLWEQLSRFSPDGTEMDDVYRAPYELEVGSHPTIDDMKICVIDKNTRPMMKEQWRCNELVSDFCDTIEDSWDGEPDARLTVQCVFERLSLISKGKIHKTDDDSQLDDEGDIEGDDEVDDEQHLVVEYSHTH